MIDKMVVNDVIDDLMASNYFTDKNDLEQENRKEFSRHIIQKAWNKVTEGRYLLENGLSTDHENYAEWKKFVTFDGETDNVFLDWISAGISELDYAKQNELGTAGISAITDIKPNKTAIAKCEKFIAYYNDGGKFSKDWANRQAFF
jgi:hypothetical protein